jgi:hypothetical protein
MAKLRFSFDAWQGKRVQATSIELPVVAGE